MSCQEKYLKYKAKYLKLKNMLGGLLAPEQEEKFNKSLQDTKLTESNKKQLKRITNQPDDYVVCIAVKSSAVVTDGNPGKMGVLGANNKKITLGGLCKDKPFDESNPTFCYTFVSVFNELIDQMKKKNISKNDPNLQLRIKQLLGLKDEWGPYTHVVMMMVKTKDLFRPCFNNDITKNTCDIKESDNEQYNKWFNKWLNTSEKEKVPFTGLGYTYDWANPNTDNKYGISEYVIKPGSEVIILNIYTLENYLELYL